MDTRKNVLSASLLLAFTITFFSTPLFAIDYSFIEGRFLLDAEFDDVNDDGDGFRFAGSFQVSNDIYAFAKYDDVELDDSDVDFSLLRIGAGYIHPLNTAWDANLSLAYADAEADGPGGSEDDSGYELSGGVRGMVKPQIEVRASLNYLDIDDSDTYFTLGGDYFFMPNIAAGVEIDLGGDYETLSIGARYFF
ncbi:MAG: porin [Candidatus Thiodiazotropha sp.]